MSRRRVPLAALALAAFVGASGATARATSDERYFALIIGHNGLPAGTTDAQLQPLRYADDDALAFYQLEKEVGAEAVLLTVPDTDTRRRHPRVSEEARPPTWTELLRALEVLNERMAALARAGGTPVFVFFYSGHGGRTESGGEKREAALTLLDGPLSQRALHEEILDKVRASLVHVVIDACHAEALVRSRDVEAQTVEIPPPEMAARLAQMAAIRFPQMGVVISSRSDAPAHEWDVYQSGVFTHEVISGLRGAADVNGDGRVEYSEMGAFLTAANREVVDPRARVRAIVQPPAINPHAPLIRIGSGTKNAWLTGIPSSAGQFYVEDGRGNRIVDGHAERGFAMSVAVPANEPLFVRDNNQEADLILRAGDRRPFELLEFHPRPVRTRGAVESSLRAGLFAMPYGPSYYSGYVDQRDAVAVVGVTREAPSVVPPRTAPATNPIVSWSLRGAAGALLVSATVFAGLAWDARSDFEQTSMQRQAAEASDRYKLDRTLALSFLISGAACAVASYLVGRAH